MNSALIILAAWILACSVAHSANEVPAMSLEDNLLKIYRDAKSLQDFSLKIAPQLLPGDDVFLQKKIAGTQEIRPNKALPPISIDHGYIIIQYPGRGEVAIKVSEVEKFEFDVNKQKVVLTPSALPSDRWQRISDALAAKTVGFSFLPQAIAAESPAATLPLVVSMYFTSALAHGHTNSLNIHIRQGNLSFLFTEVWKKALNTKTSCTQSFLQQIGRKMAELRVQEFACEETLNKTGQGAHLSGATIYQIPVLEGLTRTLTVKSSPVQAVEKASDLNGLEITYTRSSNVDEARTGQARKQRVTREKGMAWMPAGTPDPLLIDRAEQLRELLEETYTSDFCHRCGAFFKSAVDQLAEEHSDEKVK